MAVMLHTDAEVAQAWAVLDGLYAELPHNARVAGARAAAEWTTGRMSTSPITNTVRAPEGDAPVLEGVAASLVALGRQPGNREFAAGVTAWLDWIVGLQPLPRWLR